MLRRGCVTLSYQRGSWAPGSKHQKHMSMNPTMYLYRFPGPRGPGPYVMKYWWTLGCFPTGIERPFRLSEFLASYKQQHVPLEVEEWLQCFLKKPYEELSDAATELLDSLEQVPARERSRGYQSIECGIAAFRSPLAKFERQLNLRIPPLAVRAALGSPHLREQLKDDLFEYKESLREFGSTPHRRLARSALEEPPVISSGETEKLAAKLDRDVVQPAIGDAIGLYVSPDSFTMPDEKCLLRLLTTLSEGCILKEDHDNAFAMLASSLSFSHDDATDSVVHCNASTAALMGGQFQEAEFHGRQAALLEPQPAVGKRTAGRGYVLWATATAYQDDFERASRITQKGLESFPDDSNLQNLADSLSHLALKNQPSASKGNVIRSKAQQSRALLHGCGRSFDNEFDWVVFKNKLYPSKMDPSTNEMGSVFRRVGDLGGHISTSRSTEIL